jgi:NADH dehydrogenase
MGRAVAKTIARDAIEPGAPREPFRYWDKGTMATIGRSRAVAQTGKLRLSGLLAWLAWLVVHIWYLIGFRNRLVVMLDWGWSYFTYKRGARLITDLEWRPRG